MVQGADHFIVKAGGPDDHHMAREIHAHLHWLQPWSIRNRAPVLAHHDVTANLLVTRFVPGRLVEGTDTAADPAAYRQAGELLAVLHSQLSVWDDGYEAAENANSLAWLDKPHRIAPGVEEQLRTEIATWPAPPTPLVPTHGDWQPRNWLVHAGVLSVIDFGRAGLRPAISDFSRLAAQDFRRDPAL
ncbi:phosphotransferase [Pedococcus bigeumensis]|uniref:phosphotransferase n=1 Tax=Pedococcus bigeumensis TaxID=433644 RepID=UPI001F4F464F|nr:phosphotransferase [Pedococcus bigeumensis]